MKNDFLSREICIFYANVDKIETNGATFVYEV